MRSILLLSFIFTLSLRAQAELNIAPPAELIAKASQGKNQLRDVINDLDQQLTEMRDVRTFDQYFFLLDQLQALSVKTDLDSIYPQALKRLGARMVQKGVNWLDVIKSPRANILYYHRWMEPSAAFNFLYAAELQIKEEKSLGALAVAAENLEAALRFADQKWPQERTLRLLYRETLSVVAIRVLTKHELSAGEVSFWIGKIYSPESMSELLTTLQNDLYLIIPGTKEDLHSILDRLSSVHQQIDKPGFGAPEGLHSQLGDAAVDLVLKSLVYEEELPEEEFGAALEIMKLRHLSALAFAWAGLWKLPSGGFSEYAVSRAFQLVDVLESRNLQNEANTLATTVSENAASLFAGRDRLEGTWSLQGWNGKDWKLVIASTSPRSLIAALTDGSQSLRRSYNHVTYDMNQGGYIAVTQNSRRASSFVLPLRFWMQEDGTLRVEDPVGAPGKWMTAKRTQSFPNFLSMESHDDDGSSELDDPGEFNGRFRGELVLPGGRKRAAALVVTLANGVSIGNLTFEDRAAGVISLNLGTEGGNGALYLTRLQDEEASRAGTMWMQLRLRLTDDGNLKATAIYGHHGMVDQEFELKRVGE